LPVAYGWLAANKKVLPSVPEKKLMSLWNEQVSKWREEVREYKSAPEAIDFLARALRNVGVNKLL
jgi:hypothetical protein